MGLLNSLKKIFIGKNVDTLFKNTTGAAITPGNGHASPSPPLASPQSTSKRESHRSASTSIDQVFDQILATEFSDLQVIKNASPESIGISAAQPCKPYSYALLRNGKTVVAMMLTPHNQDKNSAFLNAKKSALNSNITFLNFYTHFANERQYVISRIKKAVTG